MKTILFVLIALVTITVSIAHGIRDMPMQSTYENTMEYVWAQKEVLSSRKLSDMETMKKLIIKSFS